jgi:hypothetical protein
LREVLGSRHHEQYDHRSQIRDPVDGPTEPVREPGGSHRHRKGGWLGGAHHNVYRAAAQHIQETVKLCQGAARDLLDGGELLGCRHRPQPGRARLHHDGIQSFPHQLVKLLGYPKPLGESFELCRPLTRLIAHLELVLH